MVFGCVCVWFGGRYCGVSSGCRCVLRCFLICCWLWSLFDDFVVVLLYGLGVVVVVCFGVGNYVGGFCVVVEYCLFLYVVGSVVW